MPSHRSTVLSLGSNASAPNGWVCGARACRGMAGPYREEDNASDSHRGNRSPSRRGVLDHQHSGEVWAGGSPPVGSLRCVRLLELRISSSVKVIVEGRGGIGEVVRLGGSDDRRRHTGLASSQASATCDIGIPRDSATRWTASTTGWSTSQVERLRHRVHGRRWSGRPTAGSACPCPAASTGRSRRPCRRTSGASPVPPHA